MAVSSLPFLLIVAVISIAAQRMPYPFFQAAAYREDYSRSSPSENSLYLLKKSMLNSEENAMREMMAEEPALAVVPNFGAPSNQRYLILRPNKRTQALKAVNVTNQNGKVLQKFVLVDVVDYLTSPKDKLEEDGIPTVVVPAKAGGPGSGINGGMMRFSGKK